MEGDINLYYATVHINTYQVTNNSKALEDAVGEIEKANEKGCDPERRDPLLNKLINLYKFHQNRIYLLF